MLDALFERAVAENCDFILCCGDFFEYKSVSEAERALLARKLRTCPLPVLGLPGNHDMIDGSHSNLDWLAEITKGNKLILMAHGDQPRLVSLAPGLLCALVPAFLSENAQYVEKYVADLDDGEQYVFAGHGMIGGSFTTTGRKLEGTLSLREASKSADHVVYWAYGDIHQQQRLPSLSKKANGFYPGSPVQMNFGEGPDRGFLAVDLKRGSDGVWAFESATPIRLDDHPAVQPLVTVKDANQKIPPNALLRIARGVTLDKQTMKRVKKQIVEDSGLASEEVARRIISALPFDPLADDSDGVHKTMKRGLLKMMRKKEIKEDQQQAALKLLVRAVKNGLRSFKATQSSKVVM